MQAIRFRRRSSPHPESGEFTNRNARRGSFPPRFSSGRCIALVVVAAGIPPLLGGCFDGDTLVEEARRKASMRMLEEVRLGEYRLTLPRMENSTNAFAVAINPIANVAKQDVEALEQQFQEREYELRHKTILALRESSVAELAEPDLMSLRDRVSQITTSTLDAVEIKSIVFDKFEVFAQ